MKTELSTHEFHLFRSLLLEESGIELAERKSYLVASRLRPLLESHGFETYLDLYEEAKRPANSALRTAIIDEMTTNETLWFRDPGPWKILAERVLPDMCERIAEGASIRIWSAACSTGQEPYSLAMSILEHLESHPSPGIKADSFSILGTDISPSALFVAMAGRYDQLAASRGLDPERAERFFDADGPSIVVKEEVRRMVKFRPQNLAECSWHPEVFDLVLCRNVLIYLSRDVRSQIIAGIETSLKTGGVLILGGAESLIDCASGLETQRAGSSLYYQKSSGVPHE